MRELSLCKFMPIKPLLGHFHKNFLNRLKIYLKFTLKRISSRIQNFQVHRQVETNYLTGSRDDKMTSCFEVKITEHVKELTCIVLHVRSKYCHQSCITRRKCIHTRVRSEIRCGCFIIIPSFKKEKISYEINN